MSLKMVTKLRSRLSGPTTISVLLSVLPLITSSFVVYQILQNEAWMRTMNAGQWLGLTLLFTLTSLLALTPPTLLAMVYGYFLGWGGVPYLFAMNMGAIAAVYFLTKRLFGSALADFVNQNDKSRDLLEKIKQEELKFIFLAKLSPVLPFTLTNFVFALSGASLRNILLGGFLGMIPRTLLAVWLGMQAGNLSDLLTHPEQTDVSQLIIILLVIVSTLGLIQLVSRALKN